jgi:hypothetical protein
MTLRMKYRMTRAMKSTSPTVRVATVALAALLVTTGCGSQGASDATAKATSTTVAARLGGVADPNVFRAEWLRYATAYASCLRKQGYAVYDVAPPPVEELQSFGVPFLDDDVRKRRVGYGISDSIAQSLSAAAYSVRVDPTPRSVREAPGFFAAEQACNTSLEDGFPFLQQVAQGDFEATYSAVEQWAEVEADPLMADLRKVWSTCMVAAGYTWANPWEIANELQTKGYAIVELRNDPTKVKAMATKLNRFRQDEMRIARTDADCSEPIAQQRDAIWAGFVETYRSGKLDDIGGQEEYGEA